MAEAVSASRVLGGYRLARRLSAGATSEVYLAWPEAGGDEVVVKCLQSHLAADPEAVRLLRREARVLARLRHPGVPALVASSDEGDVPYLVLERAPGASLATLRAARPAGEPLPFDAACGIVLALGAALHHVHEARGEGGELLGLVHRDVAPDNVIVAPDGRVTLVDFGLASEAADVDRDPRGSPGHMAPEQVLGLPLDRRADLFALGVLLHELTVGANPFGVSAIERTTAVVERDAPKPSACRERYPALLEAVVLAALAREVERRPASVAAWTEQLLAACDEARLVAGAPAVAGWAATCG